MALLIACRERPINRLLDEICRLVPNTEALGLLCCWIKLGTLPQLLRRDITGAIGRKADVARIPHFSSDWPIAEVGRSPVFPFKRCRAAICAEAAEMVTGTGPCTD